MSKLKLVDEEGKTVAFQVSPNYLDFLEEEAEILKVSKTLKGHQHFLAKEDLIRFYFNQKAPNPIESRYFESLEEVSDILSLPTQSVARLFDIVNELQWLTIVVTLKWEELSDNERARLAVFAYRAIGEEFFPPVQKFCSRSVGIARILGLILAGEVELFSMYILKHKALVSAILDQIERSSPEYHEILGRAVAEVFCQDEKRFPKE